MDNYQLDKWLWTHMDFDVMGWHDSLIYAFKIDQNIYFDIDYIFKWVQPDKDVWFSFWVAPCTLVFETPGKFQINLERTDTYDQIEIADLHKQMNKNGKTEWRIETHFGDISIETESFRQIVRRPPTLQLGQRIIPEERGEISFAITHEKDFTETEQVKEIKQNNFLIRHKATEVKHLKNELSNLFDNRMKNKIDAKQYILRKRHIEQQITNLKQDLKKDNVDYLADL